jgi:hypothetical protein
VWLISSPLGDDYLMTISLKSSSEEISIRRGYLVCMYPQGTHCYKESIEGKEYEWVITGDVMSEKVRHIIIDHGVYSNSLNCIIIVQRKWPRQN